MLLSQANVMCRALLGETATRRRSTPKRTWHSTRRGGRNVDVWMAANPTSWPLAKAAGHEGSTVADTADSRNQTGLTQHPAVQVARQLAEPLCARFLLWEMKRSIIAWAVRVTRKYLATC